VSGECRCPNHQAFNKHVCPCNELIRELVGALTEARDWIKNDPNVVGGSMMARINNVLKATGE
jgi:hypothetical protein